MIGTLLRSKQYHNKKNNHLIMNYFRPPAWKMPCALPKMELILSKFQDGAQDGRQIE